MSRLTLPEGWEYEIPEGWLKFSEKMWNELDALLEEHGVESFQVYSLKEKFGEIRFDMDWFDFLEDWEGKWTDVSRETCVFCGEKAEFRTEGWIEPYCGKCFEKLKAKHPDLRYTRL